MKSIEQYEKILKKDKELTVELRQETKTRKAIYVLTPDPHKTRKYMVNVTGPKYGITFATPRKTKATGYMLGIVQPGTDEVYLVKIKKGGIHQRGRQNEVNFQQFIRNQLEEKGQCQLTVKDDYGKVVELDVVDVIDTSTQHGKLNRADTTLELRDGTIYGISQKKTNANIVAKVKKVLSDILFQTEKKLREYAKANGYGQKQYMNFRITNREFIDLCWFGTDIAKGAVFIGDLEDVSSNEIHIERIIENGDDDVLTSFPIYIKWQIANRVYTMDLFGVVVDKGGTIKTIDDLELPGINAPLPNGRRFKVDEDKDEATLMEEARQDDMWDTVAWCAENHKMLWLKYETVEDGSIISRKVAPYSYRTRNTKVRGRSTYFYADDFTPGQEHGIKCFLIENCLQVKESKQSFTPRWPVEIKQEIDRLEKQRQDKEKQELKDKDKKEEPKDNEIVKPEPKKHEPPKKPEPRPEQPSVPEKPSEPKKPVQKPAAKPAEKPAPKPPPPKKEPVKVEPAKVEPDKPNPPPEKKPLPPPEKKEPDQSKNGPDDDTVKITDEPEEDNSVTLGGDDKENLSSDKEEQEQQEKDGEVQITDDDGNVLEQEVTLK